MAEEERLYDYTNQRETGEEHNLYWNNFSTRNTDNNMFLGENPITSAKIQLNGNDRFAERVGTYFNLVQPYQHHENTPDYFHE